MFSTYCFVSKTLRASKGDISICAFKVHNKFKMAAGKPFGITE